MATKQERNLPNLKIQKMTKAIYDQVQDQIGADDLVFVEDYNVFLNEDSLKTINGESIVGEGDIQIQGGGIPSYDGATETLIFGGNN